MQRPMSRFFKDDTAVSNVVAGVLTFALFMTVLVVVRIEFAPVWEKDSEAEHMLKVQGEFLDFKAEAERQAANRTGGVAVTTPVTLGGEERLRYFTGSGQPGSLVFNPRSANPTGLFADELMVFIEDEQGLFGVDEQWVEVPDQQIVEDVQRVQHLRIRVNDPGQLSGPPHGPEKGWVTLAVKDRNDDFAGDIRVYISSHPSGYNINTRVRSADTTVLYDQGHSHFSQDQPKMYWVNALSPEAQFSQVLSSAKTPLTLEWSQQELSGSYTISYLMGNENIQVGGSGRLEADWESNLDGGTMVFSSQNRYFPDQRLHYEHGALILEQDDGAVMIGAPHFRPTLVGDQTQISFTTIGLTGDQDEISSGRSAPVEALATRHSSITGTAPSFTWDQTTQFPAIWEQFWRERLVRAGLDEATGEFTITTTNDQATLTVYGTHTDPSSTEHDLSLEIRQTTLQVMFPS